jgi:hypothetical protein
MTTSLKIRRRAVEDFFRKQLDELYAKADEERQD